MPISAHIHWAIFQNNTDSSGMAYALPLVVIIMYGCPKITPELTSRQTSVQWEKNIWKPLCQMAGTTKYIKDLLRYISPDQCGGPTKRLTRSSLAPQSEQGK